MTRAERRIHRRNRNRRIRRFLVTAGIVLLITGIFAGWANENGQSIFDIKLNVKPAIPIVFASDTSEQNAGYTQGQNADRAFTYEFATTQVHVADLDDTHFLELINNDHPVNEWPDDRKLLQAWPEVPVGISQEMKLHESALLAVCDLFAANRDEGAGSLYVGSGYRDYSVQQGLYEDAADKSYVQPPGHSEHHTGLAADIYAIGKNTYEMASSREAKWMEENAWRFGLILRYAENKSQITRISYEPWHFRYVGKPHSWFIRQNDMCLEEYILFLEEYGGYEAELDGITYTVLYEKPINGLINIPENKNYEVSGDNAGGYIVTIWE